jgi:hypothetical protein
MAQSGHTRDACYLSAFGVKRTFRMGHPPWLEDACGVIFERESAGGEHSISARGAGRYIRFDPWSWLSLQRAQA